MTRPGGPEGAGQSPPPGPPSWQQAPQQPAEPASWQQAPQQPLPPAAPPRAPARPPSWSASQAPTTPAPGPAGFVYADVPNRTIAMIIDVITMFIVFAIVGLAAVAILGTTGDIGSQTPTLAAQLVGAVIGYAIWAAYFIYLWSASRGTIGMRLLGMQIGSAADGSSLPVGQAAVRFGVLFGPGIVVGLLTSFVSGLGLLGWIGFLWLIYVLVTISQSPTKQGIHDRFAQSMVVKSARRAG